MMSTEASCSFQLEDVQMLSRSQTPTEPTFYSDITRLILHTLYQPLPKDTTRSKQVLSQCALVCREWRSIVYSLRFDVVDNIRIRELPRLKDLLSPPHLKAGALHVDQRSSMGSHTPFAYIKNAMIELDLIKPSEWETAKELMRFFRDLPHKRHDMQLTLQLRLGRLFAKALRDIAIYAPALSHLYLEEVVFDINGRQLALLLCNQVFPCLRKLTIEVTIHRYGTAHAPRTQGCEGYCWGPNACPHSVLDGPPTSLELDELCFVSNPYDVELRPTMYGVYVAFWPHRAFQSLSVKRIVNRTTVSQESDFWTKFPELVKHVSKDLVELDLGHEMIYPGFIQQIQGIRLPKLESLKLQIGQQVSKKESRVILLGDTEDALRELLRQMKMPALQTLFLCIYDSNSDFLARMKSGVSFDPPSLNWDAIDDGLCESGARRIVLRIMRYQPRRRHLLIHLSFESRLPRCVLAGVELDVEMVCDPLLESLKIVHDFEGDSEMNFGPGDWLSKLIS